MSTVVRDYQKPQDIAMPLLILPRVSRQTGKLCKKTPTNNNQMSGLPGFFSNFRHRYLRQFASFFSSQPTDGCFRSWRYHRTGSEMQQLWREQHSNKLLFCLPELYVWKLFSISPTLEGHKRSSQCFDRQITSSKRARVDPKTHHVFTEISRGSNSGILLWGVLL